MDFLVICKEVRRRSPRRKWLVCKRCIGVFYAYGPGSQRERDQKKNRDQKRTNRDQKTNKDQKSKTRKEGRKEGAERKEGRKKERKKESKFLHSALGEALRPPPNRPSRFFIFKTQARKYIWGWHDDVVNMMVWMLTMTIVRNLHFGELTFYWKLGGDMMM